MKLKGFYSVREAAARLQIHEESLRRLIRQGKLESSKIGNMRVIRDVDLEKFAHTYHPDYKTPAARAHYRRRVALRDAIAAIQCQKAAVAAE